MAKEVGENPKASDIADSKRRENFKTGLLSALNDTKRSNKVRDQQLTIVFGIEGVTGDSAKSSFNGAERLRVRMQWVKEQTGRLSRHRARILLHILKFGLEEGEVSFSLGNLV